MFHFLARDGKCSGNALWPSRWSWTIKYDWNIPSKIIHHHSGDSSVSPSSLHLDITFAEAPTPGETYCRSGTEICHMEYSPVICLCPELPHAQVSPSTEQV
uniref:Uncharacterized protein n=1 Tax=Opuntia streptacantha TaxID=393608 RepID=A0A7C9DQH4_OPUST